MGTLHRLPTHLGPPPAIGYCVRCGVQCPWPNVNGRWPDACPKGCAPFSLSSTPLTSDVHVVVDGTGKIVYVISPEQ